MHEAHTQKKGGSRFQEVAEDDGGELQETARRKKKDTYLKAQEEQQRKRRSATEDGGVHRREGLREGERSARGRRGAKVVGVSCCL